MLEERESVLHCGIKGLWSVEEREREGGGDKRTGDRYVDIDLYLYA